MSHTNSTPNYGLPQFVTTDKPFWLTDINTAFSDIDTGINTAKTTADTASNNATQALSDASAAATTATGADNKATGIISSIADVFDPTTTYPAGTCVMYNALLYICTTAVTNPGPWTGVANWTRITVEDIADSKQNMIDNSLTTTNKNVVGAINELNGTKAEYEVFTNVNINPQFIDTGSDTDLRAYRIGKLIFLKGRLKVNATIQNNYGIVFGLPNPRDTYSSLMTITVDDHDFNNPANNKVISCVISTNTLLVQIYPDTIPAGKYIYIDTFYEMA